MDDETAGTDRQVGGDAEEATKEEHRVSGDKVIGKIKELIHQGNVRRIIIKNDEGRSLIEIPLSVGVVGAVLAPMWAAMEQLVTRAATAPIAVERGPDTEEDEE